MASAKLTKELRLAIRENAMVGAFQERKDALALKVQALSQVTYRTIVSEDNERIMKKLPAGFFELATAKRAYVRKTNQEGSKGTIYADMKFDNGDRRLPAFCAGHYSLEIYNDALHESWSEIESVKNGITTDLDDLSSRILDVLNSVNTVSRLIDIWPEAEAFIPAGALEKKASTLPATIIKGVSDLLMKSKKAPLVESKNKDDDFSLAA